MLWEFCIAAIFERKDKMVSRVYMHTTCFPFLSVHRGKKVSFSYLTESKRLVSPSTSCTEIPHGKKKIQKQAIELLLKKQLLVVA